LPGGGWQITRFERTTFADDRIGLSLPLNRAVIERGSTRQVVYYWFTQRGRNVANEYLSKLYLFTDAISENRTDGALVRVTTPLYPNESERDADARLQSFLRELEPRLKSYLPAKVLERSKSI
jgi:EpsI family protein